MEKQDFEPKEDLRAIRTRNILSKTLFELLSKQPIEKIGVNDICESAMIHRTTFYKHFESKYHLLSFAIGELRDSIVRECLNTKFSTEKEFYLAIANNVLDFVDERRAFLINIVDNIKSSEIILQILQTMQQNIKYIMSENTTIKQYKLPKDAISAYLTGALSSLGEWYLYHHDKTSKKEILDFLNGVFDEKLFEK